MTLADVGLGQELSGEASLAQICKWVKAEQMCVARRTVAGGPSLRFWAGKPNWPLGASCETLRLEGHCREREQQLGREAGVRIGCIPAFGKGLYQFYE